MAHWRQLFDGKYVGAWDLFDEQGNAKDVTVKIVKVEKQEVRGRQGTARKAVFYFEGKEKPWVSGVTSCQTIERLYGSDPTGWIGKWITLYPTTTTTQTDGEVPAIRVRPRVPQAGQSRAPARNGGNGSNYPATTAKDPADAPPEPGSEG